MSKIEFMQNLQSGFTEGCELRTSETIVSEEGEFPLEGTYVFLSLEDAASFFSSNYDDTMLRSGHNTRILSVEFRPGQQ